MNHTVPTLARSRRRPCSGTRPRVRRSTGRRTNAACKRRRSDFASGSSGMAGRPQVREEVGINHRHLGSAGVEPTDICVSKIAADTRSFEVIPGWHWGPVAVRGAPVHPVVRVDGAPRVETVPEEATAVGDRRIENPDEGRSRWIGLRPRTGIADDDDRRETENARRDSRPHRSTRRRCEMHGRDRWSA